MLFYTNKNITVGIFEELLKDYSKIVRINLFLPEQLIEKKAKEIINSFNKDSNKNETNAKLSEQFHKLSMINRVNNLFPAIYKGFYACYRIAELTGKTPAIMKDFEKLYYEATGKKPTIEKIEKIPEYIEILKDKYNSIHNEEENDEENSDFNFSDYLDKLELILELKPLEMRKYKLNELNRLADIALIKQKQWQKLKTS